LKAPRAAIIRIKNTPLLAFHKNAIHPKNTPASKAEKTGGPSPLFCQIKAPQKTFITKKRSCSYEQLLQILLVKSFA